ncbi:MAG: septum formation protein Maf [Calditrichaeota bacterium]|nr:MAG: septum formation protein Maf [Calditrichota bacterium]
MARSFLGELLPLQDRKLVLASESPRRIDMLRQMGLHFEIYPAKIQEVPPSYTDAVDFVRHNARNKAVWVGERVSADLIIAADTVVVEGGDIFEKPGNREEALAMLQRLSGKTHEVITGLCLKVDDREVVDHEVTRVTFYPMSEKEIEAYLDSGEPFDKAGAYGIQGLAGLFVQKVEGCYFNVVGFPLGRFYQLLKRVAKESGWGDAGAEFPGG